MTAVLPPRATTYRPDTVRDWLTTIHVRSAGWVWIGSTHDRFKGRTWNTANPDWIDQAAAYVDHLDHADAAGIYLRTTTLRCQPERRGGDHDSLTLPGLAADLDIAGPGHKTGNLALPLPPSQEAAELIVAESGLLTPSLWVHSGGGLYAWWLLDTPHPIGDTAKAGRFTARWQDVLKAAAGNIGFHYGPVGDLSRILRIPGTVNRKVADAPTACRIVSDTGIRYTLSDLVTNLHDAETALPPAPPIAVFTPRPTPAGGDLRPGEAFEQQTDWADILEPHGWVLHHQQGRTRYWTRPGKERRDGFSASTGRAVDRDRLYVFTDATEFVQHKPYTKFSAYAVLNHRGDHTTAARELARAGYGRSIDRRVAA